MPKILIEYPTKDAVPKGFEGLYVEKDGKWVFSGGDLADDSRERVGEFRERNIGLQRELEGLKTSYAKIEETYKGVDPSRFKKAEEQLAKIEKEEERKLLAEGNYDAVVDRRFAERLGVLDQTISTKDEALETRDTTIGKLKTELGKLRISAEVDQAIEEKKMAVVTGARPDIHDRTLKRFEINDDGERVARSGVLDKDGNPMSIAYHVDDLVTNAKHLFVASKGGGGRGDETTSTGPADKGDVLQAPDAIIFGRNLDKIAKGEVEVNMREGPQL